MNNILKPYIEYEEGEDFKVFCSGTWDFIAILDVFQQIADDCLNSQYIIDLSTQVKTKKNNLNGS